MLYCKIAIASQQRKWNNSHNIYIAIPFLPYGVIFLARKEFLVWNEKLSVVMLSRSRNNEVVYSQYARARQRSALTCPCCVCVQPCFTVIRCVYVLYVHRKDRYTLHHIWCRKFILILCFDLCKLLLEILFIQTTVIVGVRFHFFFDVG